VATSRFVVPTLLLLFIWSLPTHAATVGGSLVKWHPMTIDVVGPAANETDRNDNPFLDIRLNVTLTAPSGAEVQVPGFFAGDGNGNGNGNTWRIRFAPDEAGLWSYTVSFRQGNNVAVSNASSAGRSLSSDGERGEFNIADRDTNAPGLLRDGRLNYVGEHYLKQADGNYWIKGGIDSPENFFGYAGFDNTVNQSGGASTDTLDNGVHRYSDHIRDWRDGDPNFVSADTGINAKGIIGAVNYLGSEGVNSIYFLPMNLGGDGRETYPFVGTSGSDFDNTHYDVSKLYQWNIVLEHMQRQGIAAHIVLNETEGPNTRWLDNGRLGVQRKLFYRELIARFSYLNGLKWNLRATFVRLTGRLIQSLRTPAKIAPLKCTIHCSATPTLISPLSSIRPGTLMSTPRPGAENHVKPVGNGLSTWTKLDQRKLA